MINNYLSVLEKFIKYNVLSLDASDIIIEFVEKMNNKIKSNEHINFNVKHNMLYLADLIISRSAHMKNYYEKLKKLYPDEMFLIALNPNMDYEFYKLSISKEYRSKNRNRIVSYLACNFSVDSFDRFITSTIINNNRVKKDNKEKAIKSKLFPY